jgi:hypothetical protein
VNVEEGETYWNYRRFRIRLDDGDIYGMKEAYFICREGKMLLQYWDVEPMYTAQDADDLLLRIDQYAADYKANKTMPGWAEGYDEAEFMASLEYQRRACTEPVIDEEEVMRSMGE